MKKKLLIFVSAILLGTASVFAQNGTTGQLKWSIISGTLTISPISSEAVMPDYGSNNKAPWHAYSFITAIIENGVTTIGNMAFQNCNDLTSIIIPSSVATIGNLAFHNCSGLTSIIIPSSVITIGYNAFSSCSLTSIIIPNSVTTIGDGTFAGCSDLASITIPNSVTAMGTGIFNGCSSLTSIEVDTDNPNYSSNDGILYSKLQDTLIQCPGGKIGTLTILNSVKTIVRFAFFACSGLTSITISDSVTTIEDAVFQYCNGLISITIPNSVKTIGRYAFDSCSSLTSVVIGNSVTTIGSGTFWGCYNLTSITSYAITPPQVDNWTFNEVPENICISVPCESEKDYKQATGWAYFTNYTNCLAANLTEIIAAGINIYPNPASNKLYIEGEGYEQIKIYDLLGKEVLRVDKEKEIEISGFANGVYNICLISRDKTIVAKKFIKK